jgi:hypothetical protein
MPKQMEFLETQTSMMLAITEWMKRAYLFVCTKMVVRL